MKLLFGFSYVHIVCWSLETWWFIVGPLHPRGLKHILVLYDRIFFTVKKTKAHRCPFISPWIHYQCCLQKSKQHGVFCLKAAKLIFFPVQLIDWGLPLEHVQLNCSQFLHNELNWKWKRLQRMNWMAAPRQLITNRLFWTMSHAKLLSYFIPTIETWRWNWTRTLLSENSKEQQPPFYSSPVWTVSLY